MKSSGKLLGPGPALEQETRRDIGVFILRAGGSSSYCCSAAQVSVIGSMKSKLFHPQHLMLCLVRSGHLLLQVFGPKVMTCFLFCFLNKELIYFLV